jgi:hypothetical protein
MEILIMRKLANLIFWLFMLWCDAAMAGQPEPAYIGLDAEFGYQGSMSGKAIENGFQPKAMRC